MRDKTFVINSIKMDLHRVVVAAGDITQDPPLLSIIEFLHHADKDFNKIKLTKLEVELKKELGRLTKSIKEHVKDPHKRLRWAEKILTIRCRL